MGKKDPMLFAYLCVGKRGSEVEITGTWISKRLNNPVVLAVFGGSPSARGLLDREGNKIGMTVPVELLREAARLAVGSDPDNIDSFTALVRSAWESIAEDEVRYFNRKKEIAVQDIMQSMGKTVKRV